VSNRVVRTEEDDLGVSFNTQSKTPDIPGSLSSDVLSQYLTSLQTQTKVPDIQVNVRGLDLGLSLLESTEELLTSFNTQDQTPDDTLSQDHQCSPCDFV
jgi:hypothetical protein